MRLHRVKTHDFLASDKGNNCGNPRTENCPAIFIFSSSASSFVSENSSLLYSAATLLRIGSKILHGVHHCAEISKITSCLCDFLITNSWKESIETSIG
ncbi:hypothetical protein [uncultured Gammaproteobacteria bacterium]|jgi:hypothetical protein|nr:hypothetical protein [uncultured Gammaproteobacteria bacterium]CAC9524711.1 hypothetical protein [uncultured Gammaproteobacteria bacterium]